MWRLADYQASQRVQINPFGAAPGGTQRKTGTAHLSAAMRAAPN